MATQKEIDAFFGAITPAAQEKRNPKIFLYGLPGSGKTHFVGSCAKVGRTLLLKAEEGALTIAETDTKTLSLVGEGADVQKKLDFAIKMLDSPQGRESFDIVALDTLTSAQEALVAQMKAKKGGKALSLQEWGSIIDWTSEALRRLSQLQQTVIVICHSKEVVLDGADGSEVLVRPSLSGKKLVNSATAHYDIAAYCTRVTKEVDGEQKVAYVCITAEPSEKFTVKDRTGKLNRVELNDFSVWRAKIDGGDEA